jgi:hypothetical protein
MTRWLSALGLLAVGAALLAADDNKSVKGKISPKLQVLSLTIHKAPPSKPGVLMMFNNGVQMELMVSLPKRFITGVDVKASKLDRFSDDKNNALFKKSGGLLGGGLNWLSEFLIRYDPDGESVTVQFQGANPPGKGAGKILLKGSLNVKCGAEEKVTDAKELNLKSKEEADVGPFKVRVNQFGGIEVLSSDENVKKIEFLDDKGKPIMFGTQNRTRNPAPKEKLTHIYSYFLFVKPDKCTVKVHYFNKVETVTVPLDLRVGLSLE